MGTTSRVRGNGAAWLIVGAAFLGFVVLAIVRWLVTLAWDRIVAVVAQLVM